MAQIITLRNGRNETLFSLCDAYLLIEEHMGADFRSALEELTDEEYHLSDYAELEKNCSAVREHHRAVMRSLRHQSEVIAELICQETIDRTELSEAAGEIGAITWKELR